LRDFTRISQRAGAAGDVGKELLLLTTQMFEIRHQWKNSLDSLTVLDLQASLEHCRNQVRYWLDRGSICGHIPTQNTCRNILALENALWAVTREIGVEALFLSGEYSRNGATTSAQPVG